RAVPSDVMESDSWTLVDRQMQCLTEGDLMRSNSLSLKGVNRLLTGFPVTAGSRFPETLLIFRSEPHAGTSKSGRFAPFYSPTKLASDGATKVGFWTAFHGVSPFLANRG